MTQQELLQAIASVRQWADKAEEYAKTGNLSGGYTMLLLVRDSATQGIRDYNETREHKGAA